MKVLTIAHNRTQAMAKREEDIIWFFLDLKPYFYNVGSVSRSIIINGAVTLINLRHVNFHDNEHVALMLSKCH